MHDISIPCNLYRGGTSRGLLFLEEHLPYPRDVLAKVLLRIFGSPDVRQIDGVGGGTSLTSKALIVGLERTPDTDVRMTFAQVAVAAATVDWGGNCGNMTTAVGPFAIECGLVPAVEPITVVRIRSVNTGLLVRAHVPVRDGRLLTHGDYSLPGVPGTAARIDLEWLNPGGSVTGRLLPTGRPVDRFVLADGRQIEVSIVDSGNPVVFCDASALGATGTELPAQLEAQAAVMQTLEEIRSIAAELIGIVPDRTVATQRSPGLPKVGFVAPRAAYRTTNGEVIPVDAHDLHARLLSMQTAHRSYAGAAAISTAVAALLPGTIVHACTDPAHPNIVRIAHPAGVMDVEVDLQTGDSEPRVQSAKIGRTARRIMSGVAWVPADLLREGEAGGTNAALSPLLPSHHRN
jgi:2-methylaconitate cis-trans-isomerase PrpF